MSDSSSQWTSKSHYFSTEGDFISPALVEDFYRSFERDFVSGSLNMLGSSVKGLVELAHAEKNGNLRR
jgi:hypothetical protein